MYKPTDYEPVLVYGVNNKIIISRFHWKLATVWFAPEMIDSRPNVAFIKGFHTPIVQVQKRNYVHSLVMDSDSMSWKELIEIQGLCTEFKELIKRPEDMFTDPVRYDDVVTDDLIDNRYQFILKDIKGLLIVGPFDPGYLPKEFQKVLNYTDQDTGIH